MSVPETDVPETDVAQTDVPEPRTRSRVLVLAFNHRVSERVAQYARDLVDDGAEVDLVVAERNSTQEIELDPRVRVHPVTDVEHRRPLRKVENLFVFRLPGGALARARRITGRFRPLRPADAVLDLAERAHLKVARAFHRKIFMAVYRGVRPWILANAARRLVPGLDVGSAGRIVAADITSITLGWRLARRHPDIPATTSLDRLPGLFST